MTWVDLWNIMLGVQRVAYSQSSCLEITRGLMASSEVKKGSRTEMYTSGFLKCPEYASYKDTK